LFSFAFCSILFSFFGNSSFVYSLTREDGIVENFTALFYLIAFIFSLFSIFKRKFTWLSLIWSVLCILFLGEETSWFQRVFDFSVPAVESINAQNEFNLHNLNILEGGSLMNGNIRFTSFFKAQNIFRLGFFGYFLILPLVYRLKFFKGILSKIGYKKTHNAFTLILFSLFILSFTFTLISPANLKSTLTETREMLYAFFIMMYIIAYIWGEKVLDYRRPTKDLQ